MTETTIKAMTSSGKDDWETPQWLFEKLDDEFRFTLDPCATPDTAKCAKYYTKEQDGLRQNWGGETVFLQSTLQPENKKQTGGKSRG